MTNLHFRRLIDNGIHKLLYKGYCIKSLIIQRGSMDCIITRTGYPKIERQADRSSSGGARRGRLF